ncbi:MAG: methylisocitrate lyase [Gammaproteobacteria bacterium]|nr:methylisocitrate lyase [Gammaproteobacteria bacterium]
MHTSLWQALEDEKPLQIAGVINACSALLAQKAGFKTLYVSGAGVANACFALPDLGLTTLDDVLTEVRRLSAITDLPLLVDVDTGFEDMHATTQQMIAAGAAAIQIEDQVPAKRCGHRPGKKLVSSQDMQARLRAAITAKDKATTENGAVKNDKDFFIMARTDAFSVEGLDAAIQRALDYQAAGADAIFAEALLSLENYQHFTQALDIPVLTNMTEFGQTPLFTLKELASVDVAMVLYPLSAFRAMNHAALKTYQTIRAQGTQQSLLQDMQSRDELYELLDYKKHEAHQNKEHQNEDHKP